MRAITKRAMRHTRSAAYSNFTRRVSLLPRTRDTTSHDEVGPAPQYAIGLLDVTQPIRTLTKTTLEPELEPRLTTSSQRWRTEYATSSSLDVASTGRRVASNIPIRFPPLPPPNAKRNLLPAHSRAAPFQERRHLANSISRAHVLRDTSVTSTIQIRLQSHLQTSVLHQGTLGQVYRVGTFRGASVIWGSNVPSVMKLERI